MRTQARELAFKLIFERLFVKENYSFDEEFFAVIKKEEDREFSKQLVTSFETTEKKLSNLFLQNLLVIHLTGCIKLT